MFRKGMNVLSPARVISHRVAAAIIGSAEAANVTPDALVDAWRGFARLQTCICFSERLATMACSHGRTRSRSRMSSQFGRPNDMAPDVAGVVLERELLDRAFDRLTADQRVCLALKYSIDLSGPVPGAIVHRGRRLCASPRPAAVVSGKGRDHRPRGDPRLWGCPPGKEAECRQVFVADRVAWVDGRSVPVTAIQTDFYPPLPPLHMTLDEVAAGLGLSDDLVSGSAVDAGSVSQIDPRWNFTGNNVTWVLRSLQATTHSGTTRGETVWLVDDSTGQLIGSHDVASAVDYNPARLWLSGVEHCPGSCRGDESLAAYQIQSGGQVISQGCVGGTVSANDVTTFEPGFAAVLDPGVYSVTVWLANADQYGMPAEPRMDQCSTSVTADAGHNLLSVNFQAGATCTFAPLTPYLPPKN
jgi:hypothetical protein